MESTIIDSQKVDKKKQENEICSKMYQNGLDFIVYSIRELRKLEKEEVQEDEKEACLKYCLLHLSSGIELILKSRLFKEHWTYIFSDMNKASKNSLMLGSFTSTDSNTSIERLENLCEVDISKDDKKVLKEVRDLRNKFEHFKCDEEMSSIESKVNKALSFIIKFIEKNYTNFSSEEYYNLNDYYDIRGLKKEKKEENLLKCIIKETKELKKHYDDALSIAKAKAEEKDKLEELFICPKCKEKLLKCEDGVSVCYLCNHPRIGEEVADDYIHSVMGISKYEVVTQGGEYPLYTCPECGAYALVKNTYDDYQCFSCGESYLEEDLEHCQGCYALIHSSENYSEAFCDICLEYRKDKLERW